MEESTDELIKRVKILKATKQASGGKQLVGGIWCLLFGSAIVSGLLGVSMITQVLGGILVLFGLMILAGVIVSRLRLRRLARRKV